MATRSRKGGGNQFSGDAPVGDGPLAVPSLGQIGGPVTAPERQMGG